MNRSRIVTFNGVLASIASWTDTTIDAAPAAATDGPIVVIMDATASNPVFTPRR